LIVSLSSVLFKTDSVTVASKITDSSSRKKRYVLFDIHESTQLFRICTVECGDEIPTEVFLLKHLIVLAITELVFAEELEEDLDTLNTLTKATLTKATLTKARLTKARLTLINMRIQFIFPLQLEIERRFESGIVDNIY